MSYIYRPPARHRCCPPEGGPYLPRRELGSWWKCDDCGALWEFTYGPGIENVWEHRRPTKRVLRRIARLTGGAA